MVKSMFRGNKSKYLVSFAGALLVIAFFLLTFYGCPARTVGPKICIEIERTVQPESSVESGESFDLCFEYWAPLCEDCVFPDSGCTVKVRFSAELPLRVISGDTLFKHFMMPETTYTVCYTLRADCPPGTDIWLNTSITVETISEPYCRSRMVTRIHVH